MVEAQKGHHDVTGLSCVVSVGLLLHRLRRHSKHGLSFGEQILWLAYHLSRRVDDLEAAMRFLAADFSLEAIAIMGTNSNHVSQYF